MADQQQQQLSSITLIPAGVPVGYAGESRPHFTPAGMTTVKAVYNSPSIMRSSAVEAPGHFAGYWYVDPLPDRTLAAHPIVGQSPSVPARTNLYGPGAASRPTGRVYHKGQPYYLSLKAPSLDTAKLGGMLPDGRSV